MLSKNKNQGLFAGFVIGSLVGAGLALLLTPQPGKETRTKIKNKSFELKDVTVKRFQGAGHRTQEKMAVWQEKGKETLARSKQRAGEAIGHGKERVMEAISHRKDNKHTEETMAEAVASEAEQMSRAPWAG